MWQLTSPNAAAVHSLGDGNQHASFSTVEEIPNVVSRPGKESIMHMNGELLTSFGEETPRTRVQGIFDYQVNHTIGSGIEKCEYEIVFMLAFKIVHT